MSFPVLPHGFLGAQGDSDTYRIERSLRFNSADSAYLSRTPSTTTNGKTWTYSTWIKRAKLSSASSIFFGWNGSNTSTVFQITSSDNLELYNFAGAYYAPRLITNQLLRDLSAWYHIVLVWDANNATSSDRQRIYINGQRVTSFSTESYSNDVAYGINIASYPHGIGGGAGSNFDGYMAETNFIDGQALTPSSFGETDAITGRWKAKAFTGTYGTNGFYLKFADNSGTTSTTLGKDSSGNGNNWTPNNFSVTAGADNDSLVDSPTNYGTDTGLGGEVRGNYCTINPLKTNSSITISDGNLKTVKSVASNNLVEFGSVGVNSGKWYWEVKPTLIGGFYYIGIGKDSAPNNTYPSVNDILTYGNDGTKYNGSGSPAYGSTYSANDVIGVGLDCDVGTIVFYKNNVSQGTAFSSGISGSTWFAYAFVDGTNNSHTTEWNFGQRPFAYTAPSGFKALCTQNLTQPTIQKPSTAMDVVTYTGTGASRSITGLGFSPELVWVKGRSVATNNVLFDIIRGANKELQANNTSSETTRTDALTSFNSDGFSLGADAGTNVNYSGATFVAWSWDAGSTNSTNTSGSITSTVRANPQAGFSIVSFVNASGTNQSTVGHGLGSSPKMIIAKNRDTGANNWAVFHSSVCDTTSKFLQLNTTAALTTFTTVWGASLPSSSVFGVTGGGVGAASVSMIAYCFAEIEGYSKIGSYTGNGSADGPFVWCGFRPRWVMQKRTDSADNWNIFDTSRSSFNVTKANLEADTSDAEATTFDFMDILSNGFKLKANLTSSNASGGTYIFAAFAESPFKYARAR